MKDVLELHTISNTGLHIVDPTRMGELVFSFEEEESLAESLKDVEGDQQWNADWEWVENPKVEEPPEDPRKDYLPSLIKKGYHICPKTAKYIKIETK